MKGNRGKKNNVKIYQSSRAYDSSLMKIEPNKTMATHEREHNKKMAVQSQGRERKERLLLGRARGA